MPLSLTPELTFDLRAVCNTALFSVLFIKSPLKYLLIEFFKSISSNSSMNSFIINSIFRVI
jgi:hypothetical protein